MRIRLGTYVHTYVCVHVCLHRGLGSRVYCSMRFQTRNKIAVLLAWLSNALTAPHCDYIIASHSSDTYIIDKYICTKVVHIQYMVHMYHTCESNNRCPSPAHRSGEWEADIGLVARFVSKQGNAKKRKQHREKTTAYILIENTCYEELFDLSQDRPIWR